MKWSKIAGMISIALLLACASVSGGTYKNEPNGFRDIKWGAEISSLKDTVPLFPPEYADLKNQLYLRTGDTLTVNEAKAKSIEYNFLDGRFCQVHIWIEGIESVDAFKRTLFELFGEPNKRQKTYVGDDDYTWEGDITEIAFLCSIDRGLIQMTSTQIKRAEMGKAEHGKEPDREGKEWKVFLNHKISTKYYHSKSIIRPSKGKVRIWFKNIYYEDDEHIPEYAREAVKEHGTPKMTFDMKGFFKDIVSGNEERCLCEIDCFQRMHRTMFCDFYDDGELVGSTRKDVYSAAHGGFRFVHQIELNKEKREWNHIEPDTPMDSLFNRVCP